MGNVNIIHLWYRGLVTKARKRVVKEDELKTLTHSNRLMRLWPASQCLSGVMTVFHFRDGLTTANKLDGGGLFTCWWDTPTLQSQLSNSTAFMSFPFLSCKWFTGFQSLIVALMFTKPWAPSFGLLYSKPNLMPMALISCFGHLNIPARYLMTGKACVDGLDLILLALLAPQTCFNLWRYLAAADSITASSWCPHEYL